MGIVDALTLNTNRRDRQRDIHIDTHTERKKDERENVCMRARQTLSGRERGRK